MSKCLQRWSATYTESGLLRMCFSALCGGGLDPFVFDVLQKNPCMPKWESWDVQIALLKRKEGEEREEKKRKARFEKREVKDMIQKAGGVPAEARSRERILYPFFFTPCWPLANHNYKGSLQYLRVAKKSLRDFASGRVRVHLHTTAPWRGCDDVLEHESRWVWLLPCGSFNKAVASEGSASPSLSPSPSFFFLDMALFLGWRPCSDAFKEHSNLALPFFLSLQYTVEAEVK